MSTGDQKDILNPAGATADARGVKETENTSSGISIPQKRRKMMIAIPVKMPDGCFECRALGIFDLPTLKCPHKMYMEIRPKECPLKEIKTYYKDTVIPQFELEYFGDDEIKDYVLHDAVNQIANAAIEDKLVAHSMTRMKTMDAHRMRVKMSIVEEKNTDERDVPYSSECRDGDV